MVDESRSLEPLTEYSRFKMLCEQVLAERMHPHVAWTVIRPATVCGYAPRQRLDVIVNIFVSQAMENGVLSVFGGSQLRPNIHIDDMVDSYLAVLFADTAIIAGKTYNVGDVNYSVSDLANMTQRVLADFKEITVEYQPSEDNRSYHVSSERIKLDLNFVPRRGIPKAIADLAYAMQIGLIKNPTTNPLYSNIKMLQKKGFN
jgi:nucleoside-diphosphate-sugar epimerase